MRNRFAEFESFLGADDEFFFLHGAKGASVSELAMGWDRADWVGRGGDAGTSIPLSSERRTAEVTCRRCRLGSTSWRPADEYFGRAYSVTTNKSLASTC